MALRVSTGFSRKVGQPDYGSVGANCHVEFELDPSLLEDLDTFHQRVQGAFIACHQAVNDELARQQGNQLVVKGNTENHQSVPSSGNTHSGNGHSNGNGGKPATEKQLKFIGNLVRSIRGLGSGQLEQLSNQMFGKPIGHITSFEASALIDQLKAVKSGDIDIAAALAGTHG